MKRFLLAALCLSGFSQLRAADSLRLDVDENLFDVLTAINVAGYDEGINLPGNSPVRAQVVNFIRSQNLPVVSEMQRFYKRHMLKDGVQDLSQYISWALSVKGAPDFAWKGRDVEIPPDALALSSFGVMMIDFYRQANLGELWRKVKPAYEKELDRYHAPILAMTGAVDGYLRVPTGGYLNRHFQVYVDLMGAPGQVQIRNYADESYVILTPSEQPRMYDLRHAYLHFQIDPIMIKYGVELGARRSLLDLVQTAPMEDMYKTDFVLLANESLIKSVEARLDKDRQAADRALRQGYIMTPFFSEQLPVFEQQQQGLRFFAADMVMAMNVDYESKRLSTVAFDRNASQRVSKTVVVAAPPLSAAGKTLEKAEALYSERKMDDAKKAFLKSLEESGAPEEHAQAWYGLARLDILGNQPDAAVKLLEKTLESQPDDFTRAWAEVYLGRLALASSDPAGAQKHFENTLAVKAASEKAQEAARAELKKIRENKILENQPLENKQ